jgi:hypothetical protein
MCRDEMIGYGAKQGVAVLSNLVCDGHGKSAIQFLFHQYATRSSAREKDYANCRQQERK